MVHVLGKLALSFLVTNWIYSEICLFFPEFGPFAKQVVAELAIPTHDKWPAILESPRAKRLAADIDSTMESSRYRSTFQALGLTDRSVLSVLSGGEEGAKPAKSSRFVSFEELESDPFYSIEGERIRYGGYRWSQFL